MNNPCCQALLCKNLTFDAQSKHSKVTSTCLENLQICRYSYTLVCICGNVRPTLRKSFQHFCKSIQHFCKSIQHFCMSKSLRYFLQMQMMSVEMLMRVSNISIHTDQSYICTTFAQQAPLWQDVSACTGESLAHRIRTRITQPVLFKRHPSQCTCPLREYLCLCRAL